MKSIRPIQKAFASALCGLALLFGGCGDAFNPPEPAQGAPADNGAVTVRIQIGSPGNSARTLWPTFPSTPADEPTFTDYTLSWYNAEGTGSGSTSIPGRSTDVQLSIGTWTFNVTGYLTLTDDQYPAGRRVSGAIATRTFKIVSATALAPYTLQPNENVPFDTDTQTIGGVDVFCVTATATGNKIVYGSRSGNDVTPGADDAAIAIKLYSGADGEGEGQFAYTIAFRSGNLSQAGLKMFKINGTQVSPTASLDKNLLSGDIRPLEDYIARGSGILPSGYYLLKVQMNNRTVKTEVVHIYSGLTTSTRPEVLTPPFTQPLPFPSENYIFYDGEFDDILDLQAYLSSSSQFYNESETPYWISLVGTRFPGTTTISPTNLQGKYVYLDLRYLLYPSAAIPKFTGCDTLVGVALPALTTIAQDTFKGCTELRTVTIPASVEIIGENAFQGCTALARVTFRTPSILTYIDANAFQGCTALASVTIPASVGDIGISAFQDCTALASVYFPSTLAMTTVSDYAFKNTGLEAITLPIQVTTIGNYAFQNCNALISVTIRGEATIGNNAFQNCSALTSVDMESVTIIGNSAFRECTKLDVSSNFQNMLVLTNIGNYAFRETKIRTVNLSNSNLLTNIGNNAFKKCSSLTSVMLPNATDPNSYLIGSEAFAECSLLDSVRCYDETPPRLSGGRDEFPESVIISVPQANLQAYRTAWTEYDSSRIQPFLE